MNLNELVRTGGRPRRDQAAALGDKILDAATALFLKNGFRASSIEAVAAQARVSKRTLYHRFRDKADLYRAVVRRLLDRWLPDLESAFEAGGPFDETLLRLAEKMLSVALTPEALALRHLLLSEAERFPELVAIAMEQGAGRAIERTATLLETERRAGRIRCADCRFAATQFQEMVLSLPLRRASGLGVPMCEEERALWVRQTVALFLDGCRGA